MFVQVICVRILLCPQIYAYNIVLAHEHTRK